ncbi:alpha/beta fold hydrolase [Pseudomonas ovata]|uniref:alpha/beta fold hydrolase n=1 Tax=Pseudomonas ovata TaxID=1839709 RepID=UPI000D696922|nr:alpha/beta fold hydrolase [Pseudomonas ovata]
MKTINDVAGSNSYSVQGVTDRRVFNYIDTDLGQLHYAECGAGDAMILLHQTPRSLDEFAEVQPLLASRWRTIAMDMYGFGQSAKFSAPQTVEQYAQGVLALVDALNIERFSIVGHHTGMFVASEVAAIAPARVTAVVLSAGDVVDAAFREAMAALDVDVAETREDGSHLMELWRKRLNLYPFGHPDVLNRFIRDALAPGVTPLEGHLAVARYDMESRIGLVKAPVLVLAATDDPVTYARTQIVVDAYCNSCFVSCAEIEGGGIPLMELKSKEVAATVYRFFDQLEYNFAGGKCE